MSIYIFIYFYTTKFFVLIFNLYQQYIVIGLLLFKNKIQSTHDITNFKGPSKKFVILKVCYIIKIHYIKSINQ